MCEMRFAMSFVELHNKAVWPRNINWKHLNGKMLSTLFSVTGRSRSDKSHSLSHLLSVSIDFTDVTLVSEDTYRRLD